MFKIKKRSIILPFRFGQRSSSNINHINNWL